MPDSQNKQGEQSDTPRTNAVRLRDQSSNFAYEHMVAHAEKLERELSLLSQQHAPPKEVEVIAGKLAQWIQDHFPHIGCSVDYIKAGLIPELAAELTKEREERCEVCNTELCCCGDQDQDGEPSLDCPLCRIREKLQDGYKQIDNLKQQLAEAKEKLQRIEAAAHADAVDLEKMRDGTKLTRAGVVQALVFAQEELAEAKENNRKIANESIANQLALSAVVEKMKRGLESIVHECGINPTGEYYIIAHAATQLLADLGHK